MNYYTAIREKILQVEIYNQVHDYAKDKNKVKEYYEIGRLLSEAGGKYGKNIIGAYSEKLMVEVGKKYNYRTLYRMRKFYEVFSNEKLTPLGSKLSWSHYRELSTLKDINAIKYYIEICLKNNLSKRDLIKKIKNQEYERLSEDTKKKLSFNEEITVYDLVPNPIIIRTDTLNEKITEYALKQMIINNLDEFLFQLGVGFTYVGAEYKIKIHSRYNYIDLLLYNYEFNCFVVVELKVTELKKDHLGQIQVYMNYVDKNIRKNNQDKTIGIVICKNNDGFYIEYSSDERIIARNYKLV